MAIDFNYTKEDFRTSKPYEEIESIQGGFDKSVRLDEMMEYAKSIGIRNFRTLYNNYIKQLKSMSKDYVENASDFDGQEFEINTGKWRADDYGITKDGGDRFGEIVACTHPLMPVMRLVDVDSGMEKVKLAYKRGAVWYSTICNRKTIASKNLIVDLSDYGIAVNSENAKAMVEYLADAESLNYSRIPVKKSVGRLGWVGDDGFSPYMNDLIFDGENNFKTFFDSVSEKGSRDEWFSVIGEVRKSSNIVPKIVLAASFASVLVEPCSCLPFFVHLWGGTETGKTVAILMATSVWADPTMGKYAHSFNSTAVAQELAAGFVNSMPLVLDELQIKKDRKDFDQMIYQLSEGVGKMRGQKTGGLQQTGTWKNCILTTGEQPITSLASGGGAINRVVEISCSDLKLFDNPVGLMKVLQSNYGFAGRQFVSLLHDDKILEEARNDFEEYREYLNKANADDNENATEKQSMAGGMILTADRLIDKYIFKDDKRISPDELLVYLSTKEGVDQNLHAWEWLENWLVINQNNFSEDGKDTSPQQTYGKIGIGYVAICKYIFIPACTEAGFNAQSLMDWLKRTGRSECQGKRNDKPVKINGKASRCICLKSDSYGNFNVCDENIAF